MLPPVEVYLDPRCMQFAPLTGWRLFLNKWLRINVPRNPLIVHLRPNVYVTNPANAVRVREVLEANNARYLIHPYMEVVDGKVH
jgi:hypothetical protein